MKSGKRERKKNVFRVFELFFLLEEEEGTKSSSRFVLLFAMDMMGHTPPHFYTHHLYLYLFTLFPAKAFGGIRIVGGAKRKKTWTFFAVFGLVGL
jgi:hypothetical protein